MKNLIFTIIGFCFSFGFVNAQNYKYYIYLSDYKLAPTFSNLNGLLIYSGTKLDEKTFYLDKNLTFFQPAFEDAIDINVKNIYFLETTNSSLVSSMKTKFPSVFIKSDDITNLKYETLSNTENLPIDYSKSNIDLKPETFSTTDYYPNDYGSSSPNANLGFNFNKKEWDYLHVPKAWGITTGLSSIKIGISDHPIKSNDPDFLGKITPIDGYSLSTPNGSHGTDVAATAAARGNNGYGSAGVCMDCSIVEGPIFWNSIAPGPNLTYSGLYKMAIKGAKVINMSWHNSGYRNMDKTSPDYYNPGNTFPILAEQLVINDLVNNFRVTMVAASGNTSSFGTPTSGLGVPYGIRYMYPSSYDNVISVSSVQHLNAINLPLNNSQPSFDNISPFFPLNLYLEDTAPDCVSALDPNNPISVIRNGWYQSPNNPDGFGASLTYNDKVDILAPGSLVYSHSGHLLNPVIPTTAGTSSSAPTVSGTIGLMLSLNDCLLPSEIEDIMQLTAKDIEVLPINIQLTPAFQTSYPSQAGYLGAGKLEVGDAVEFTNEMKKTTGSAIVKNHIFNRFDFNLNKINNNLLIENVTFKDACKVDFIAKNQINLLPGTNLKPNLIGSINLGINSKIDITCLPIIFPSNRNFKDSDSISLISKTVLFLNPNNGSFRIFNIQPERFGKEEIVLNIYDLNGRSLFTQKLNKNDLENCQINLIDLQNGIYLVRLSSSIAFEDLKFIKN